MSLLFTLFTTRLMAQEELMPCELENKTLKYASWFPIDQAIQYEQVVLLAPGLNLNPARLHSLASAFVKFKSRVMILDVESDDPITSRLHHSLCAAAAAARDLGPQVKVFALGHSLSGLALLDLQTRSYHQKLAGLILIAPSLFPRFYTRALSLLDWLPFGGLPSLNFENYRQNDFTSFKRYREMRLIREHLWDQKEVDFAPTLIFMAPGDELLDFAATREYALKHNLIFHKLMPSSQLSRTIDHLLIDPPSMGAAAFSEMVQKIGNFLARE